MFNTNLLSNFLGYRSYSISTKPSKYNLLNNLLSNLDVSKLDNNKESQLLIENLLYELHNDIFTQKKDLIIANVNTSMLNTKLNV